MEPREIFYANRDGSNGMPAKNTVVSDNYEIVAEFFGTKEQQNREARLLLTAPELKKAMRQLAERVSEIILSGDNGDAETERLVLLAQAAIAKAEGREG